MDVKKKILIVDDQEDIRDLYALALEESNYEVKTVDSRLAAQQVIASGWAPDLLMVDFRMPGVLLEEFLLFLDRETNVSIQVVVFSSFSRSDHIIQDSHLKVPFFQKPTSIAELLTLVGRQLEHKK